MIEAVLFANEIFYQAFVDRNLDAMDELWSTTAPVTCLHPGWGPVVGRERVMESWKAIVSHPEAPRIRCHMPEAFVYGNAATVLCFEEIEGRYLTATNVFVREGRVWKMAHHQSGPTAAHPEVSRERPSGPVN